MIGTALTIGAAIASGLGSIKSAQANRNYDLYLQRRGSELQSWYDKEYNTNYLDTAEAKSTAALLRESLKDRLKKVDQGNAIAGSTDESRIAMADSGQKNYSGAITRLAGYGTQYKDAIRREYSTSKNYLAGLEAQNLLGKSQYWSNFSNNAMKAGIGFAEADGIGAFDNADMKFANYWRNRKAVREFNKTGPVFRTFPMDDQ